MFQDTFMLLWLNTAVACNTSAVFLRAGVPSSPRPRPLETILVAVLYELGLGEVLYVLMHLDTVKELPEPRGAVCLVHEQR